MDLRIEHLSKTYPNGVRALDDVSLIIPRGMYGLLRAERGGQVHFDAHHRHVAGAR